MKNHFNQFSRKESSDSKSNFVEQLKIFYYPSLKYIQSTSNCIFSMDNCSGLIYFKVSSFPMLHLYFSLFFILGWMVWWNIYRTEFEVILGVDNDTDTFGHILVSIATILAQYVLHPDIIFRRSCILNFWNKLHKCLQVIYAESSNNRKAYITEKLKQNGLQFRNLMLSIFVCCLINGSVLYWSLSQIIPSTSIPGYRRWIHSAGIIYWGLFFILTLCRVVWFIQLICLISIGFSSLKIKDASEKFEYFLNFHKHYNVLEGLVVEFNQIFWVQIVISIIGIGSILINSTYNTFTSYGDGTMFALIMHTSTLITPSFLVLYILFSFGTKLTEHAQSTMTQVYNTTFENGKYGIDNFEQTGLAQQRSSSFMKAIICPPVISPGNFFHVNRRTLTSILSGILTYIIVLLQFRSIDITDPRSA